MKSAALLLGILLAGACASDDALDEETSDEDFDVEADEIVPDLDPGDPGDDLSSIEAPLVIEEASVAQCNPFYGGKFSGLDTTGAVTYKTMTRFGDFVAARWPRVSVIGMQEITSEQNAQDIAMILSARTGHPWQVQRFGRGTYAGALPSTQEAIFWRSDVWTLGDVFGTREVQRIDSSLGKASFSIRFGGLLLTRNGTAHRLAMFTGKHTWLGRKRNGKAIDNAARAKEAQTLMAWIDEKLAGDPTATRVIATDVNADYSTAPWDQYRKHYADGGDQRATHFQYGSRRIDALFWDYDAGPRRSSAFGFVGGPYRSDGFGSDHRAIAARIKLR